jgi:hypothetical protein
MPPNLRPLMISPLRGDPQEEKDLQSKTTKSAENPNAARKAGDPNGDGTFFGGGPNTFHCSKCRAAGYPDAVAHGHRSNQTKYCPLLQGLPEKADPELEQIIEKCIPVASKPAKAQTKSESDSIVRYKSAEEILDLLEESQITAKAAKFAFMRLMATADSGDRDLLTAYIKSVSDLDTDTEKQKPAGLSMPGSVSDPSKGKLARLYNSMLKAVRTDLHLNTKPDSKQTMKFDVLTGQMLLDVPEDEPVPSVAVFILTLENFRHAVRTRDYLGELETHALIVWTSTQLALGTKLVVIERTVKKMLDMLDTDMSMLLSDIIRQEARTLLEHQQQLFNSSSFRDTAPTATAAQKAAAAKTAAAAAKTAAGAQQPAKALARPNNWSCWFWTNDFACKHKTNGTCNHSHLHGTCGAINSSNSAEHCIGKHKATEHTAANAEWSI